LRSEVVIRRVLEQAGIRGWLKRNCVSKNRRRSDADRERRCHDPFRVGVMSKLHSIDPGHDP
jgi:hypothetical protein